jgi:hypothetical protein
MIDIEHGFYMAETCDPLSCSGLVTHINYIGPHRWLSFV